MQNDRTTQDQCHYLPSVLCVPTLTVSKYFSDGSMAPRNVTFIGIFANNIMNVPQKNEGSGFRGEGPQGARSEEAEEACGVILDLTLTRCQSVAVYHVGHLSCTVLCCSVTYRVGPYEEAWKGTEDLPY